MKVYFAPSFLKVTKKLDPNIRENIKSVVAEIMDFYESGEKKRAGNQTFAKDFMGSSNKYSDACCF